MRVLLLKDSEENVYEAKEISDMWFESYIKDIRDYGLYLVTRKGERLYIPRMTKSECNTYCMEIVRTGYCNLTRYGEYIHEESTDE